MPRGLPLFRLFILQPYETGSDKGVDPGTGVHVSGQVSGGFQALREYDLQADDEVVCRASRRCNEDNDGYKPMKE